MAGAWAQTSQQPGPDVGALLRELGDRLPCDEDAGRVLSQWALSQSDPAGVRAVIDLLVADVTACEPVRAAAIEYSGNFAQTAVGADLAPAPGRLSPSIAEAFDEAAQSAEKSRFSVEPPPRNLTRHRIYQP